MTASNLSIGYDRILASGLSITLEAGKVTSLIGRNGVGKSTLIKTLTGVIPPLKGSVFLRGKPIQEISRKEMAGLIALVSTDSHAAGGLRLHELVALGRIPFIGRFGILNSSDREKVDAALETVGIWHKRNSFVSQLSDGERQKGMIARALVQETPIIIMDEPFSFLDAASRLEMLALVKSLTETHNKAVLFSTHEVSEALRYTDTVWMFTTMGFVFGTPSRIIENGDIDHLFPNPSIMFDRKSMSFTLKDCSQNI